MKITFLGQAGLLFETEGKTILVDPYLSDSVAKINPLNVRRVAVDEKFLEIKPDVIICTHNHLDHTDKETLKNYLNERSKVLVLSPYSSWKEIKSFGGKDNNYVTFNSGTVWTEKNMVFTAVKAEHSDEYAIGVIIKAEGKNYYVTGETLYNENVIKSLPKIKYEALFMPVNGVGNNMNFADAEKFARKVKAKNVVPVHIGLFDDITADGLRVTNKVTAEIYQEIKLK